MAERIKTYRRMMDNLLKEEMSGQEWEEVRTEHLTQVGFFQHERLIHLMVTLAFAVFFIMTFLTMMISFQPALLVLMVALLVLLIPYIRHYYLLENEVQAMYKQYDEIVKKISACRIS